MKPAGVMRYVAVGAFLLLLAACGRFPGMRTSMPPPPAETPPAAAPAQAPTPDLPQQVQNLEARVQQLESRLAALEGHPGAPATAKPPATVSGAAAAKYYNEGMRHYHAKKYGDARTQFSQYLKHQPKGPRAAEARYYLADSFYQEAKYREAAVEFNKLRLQFPQSILAPAGMLRQALCYKNQHQMSTYRSTLNKLVKAYPNSPEAKEARKWLKEGQKEASR
ncbi:MAG: tetratricopeptide repeat protein [Desulfobaccales bacterium]